MPSDNRGAGVSGLAVDPKSTSAVISWDTNLATGSGVQFGTSEDYTESSAYDSSLVTSHHVTLTGLSPEMAYHFAVGGLDDGNAPVYSGDNTFLTLSTVLVQGSAGGKETQPTSATVAP